MRAGPTCSKSPRSVSQFRTFLTPCSSSTLRPADHHRGHGNAGAGDRFREQEVGRGRPIAEGEKVDRRIVAIAEVHGVDELYSDDDDVRCLADVDAVVVRSVADMPSPRGSAAAPLLRSGARVLPEPGAAAAGNAAWRGDGRHDPESRTARPWNGRAAGGSASRPPAGAPGPRARIFWRLGAAGGEAASRRCAGPRVGAHSRRRAGALRNRLGGQRCWRSPAEVAGRSGWQRFAT